MTSFEKRVDQLLNDAKTSAIFSDRLRLILLLDACEAADLAPVPILRLQKCSGVSCERAGSHLVG